MRQGSKAQQASLLRVMLSCSGEGTGHDPGTWSHKHKAGFAFPFSFLKIELTACQCPVVGQQFFSWLVRLH